MKISRTEFDPNSITKFRIKEDVIFDRNLGRKVTRIIGLAPLLDKKSSSGEYIGTAPFFWLYYPDIRDVLAQYEVFNPENDVARMTWDDYLKVVSLLAIFIKLAIHLMLVSKTLVWVRWMF